MIVIDDRNLTLDLNLLDIYLMLTAEEQEQWGEKLKGLNTYRSMTRGIFRFVVVEKGDAPYNLLPVEMTRAVRDCNVLVRFVNSIHFCNCYGLDWVDFSMDAEGVRRELRGIVDEVCRKNIDQLDILRNRPTSSAESAYIRYARHNMVQETFEKALKGEIIPKEQVPTGLIGTLRALDARESQRLVHDILNYAPTESDDSMAEERHMPVNCANVEVTIKKVKTGKQISNGTEKVAWGVALNIEGDVIEIPCPQKDQIMLYAAVLLAYKTGMDLTRRDFTDNAKTVKRIWLKKLFGAFGFDGDFNHWFEMINKNGKAARISDAKSKWNNRLHDALPDKYRNVYYYCCINMVDARTDSSNYMVKLNRRNIHFDERLLKAMDDKRPCRE